MQAYFLELINLDIYIERGGKEKQKKTTKKNKSKELQSLSQQK